MQTFISQRTCFGCSIFLFLLGSIFLYVHISRSQNIPNFLRKLPYNVTDLGNFVVSEQQECPKENPHATFGHLGELVASVPDVISFKDGETHFNRALLLNAGFIESKRVTNFDCFIFHDVDLLPEDDRNSYRCANQPRHLSVAVDKFNYRLPYLTIFGGAVAFTKKQFEKVGGFSNMYFGWGGEDDDLYARVVYHNYSVMRYPEEIARYRMISHNKDPSNPVNPKRNELLKDASSRFKTDDSAHSDYLCCHRILRIRRSHRSPNSP
ncbi:unnamed protein product [Schistosoma intercalatum]|nr:unnamed protein product [Schistosoma intercalatum]